MANGSYGTQNNCGIYCITNTANGKKYVGQTKHLLERQRQHFSALRANRHHNLEMQKDYNEHPGNFTFKILEKCPMDKLDEREKYWIDTLGTMIPNGYNQTWNAYGREHQEKPKVKKPKFKGYHKSS